MSVRDAPPHVRTFMDPLNEQDAAKLKRSNEVIFDVARKLAQQVNHSIDSRIDRQQNQQKEQQNDQLVNNKQYPLNLFLEHPLKLKERYEQET